MSRSDLWDADGRIIDLRRRAAMLEGEYGEAVAELDLDEVGRAAFANSPGPFARTPVGGGHVRGGRTPLRLIA